MGAIAYEMKIGGAARQRGDELSFIGGAPRTPAALAWPSCTVCGASQTFFLQVAMPADHAFAGKSIAVFACASCSDDEHLIPEMLTEALKGADVSAAFLRDYQKNFRIVVFDTAASGAPNPAIEPRLQFRPITLAKGAGSRATRLGGAPLWLLDDEAPGSCAGAPIDFLFQLADGLTFKRAPGAPPQMELSLRGTPEPSPDPFYRLFLSNRIFFFGARGSDLVYVLTQI